MDLERTTLAVRGGKFEVPLWRGGAGEPLLFLHGAQGPRPSAPFLAKLADRFDVLAPAHPGWQRATGLEHLDDIQDLAVYYLDFLDALGLQSVHVVGHSLGGMLAAEVAAVGGSYVRRLVLANAVGLWLEDAQPLDIFTASAEKLQQAVYHDPARASELAEPGPDPEDKDAVAKASLERQLNLAAAGKFIWPIPDKGLKKRIHRIKAPTLIVWGESDGVVPPVHGQEFQRLIGGSRLVVMQRCGHVPMLEEPDEFVRLVSDFLEGGT